MNSEDNENRDLFDLIEKMLEYEPYKRITLKGALCHEFFKRIPVNLRHSDDSYLNK